MTDTLYAALLAAQSEAPGLQKTSINPHFKNKYVSLESLMDQILPILNNHGLVLLQAPTTIDGAPALRTKIVHAKTGEFVEDTMLLEATKRDPQAQGSAITYARRYSLMALLGLVADVDDDGAAGSRRQNGSTRSAGASAQGMPGGGSAKDGQLPRGRSSATDGNQPSPGVNPAMVSKEQHGLIGVLIKELDQKRPDGAPWVDRAKKFAKDEFGLESRANLTSAQAHQLIEWLKAEEIPF